MKQITYDNLVQSSNVAGGYTGAGEPKMRYSLIHRSTCLASTVAVGLALSLPTLGCGSDSSPPRAASQSTTTSVTVNELQSKNSTIESDTGKKSDWVELYNPGDSEENLEGYFISDNKDAPQKAMLPAEAAIPAQGFLVLWLDGTTNPDAPLHFPFKLSGDGENFYFNAPNGHVIQQVAIPADPTGADTTAPDVSYGAYPDGSDTFGWCHTPTLGKPNSNNCLADAGS